MRITKYIEMDAGHRVPLHQSKCKNPHGHRYRVTIEVEGRVPEDGMVIDFGILKEMLTTFVHDPMDHSMILQSVIDDELGSYLEDKGWQVYWVDKAPTAENLAEHIGRTLIDQMTLGLNLVAITVRETPSSTATWRNPWLTPIR